MAITATTAAAAIGANDTVIFVTSATGINGPTLNTGVITFLQIDNEFCFVSAAPVGTAVPVQRGMLGSGASAHVNGAIISIGVPADFPPVAEYVFKSLTSIEGTLAFNRQATNLSGSADALSGAPGLFVVKTAGVDAMTLPTATAAMEGNQIEVYSDTANAHTITCASAVIAAGQALKTVITLPAFAGAGCILQARNLRWHLVSAGPGGVATAATGGTPIGSLVLT